MISPSDVQYDHVESALERLPDTGITLISFGAFGLALAVAGLILLRETTRCGE